MWALGKINIFNSYDTYRGVSREPFVVRYGNIRELDMYFSLVEDEFIPFNSHNLQKLLSLCASISKRKKGAEIIVYGEMERLDFSVLNKEKASFLGYDVSGESMYISFIKDAMYNEQECSMTNIHQDFRKQLNENGLFDLKEQALRFVKHIYKFSDMYETDGELKLLAVFKITG